MNREDHVYAGDLSACPACGRLISAGVSVCACGASSGLPRGQAFRPKHDTHPHPSPRPATTPLNRGGRCSPHESRFVPLRRRPTRWNLCRSVSRLLPSTVCEPAQAASRQSQPAYPKPEPAWPCPYRPKASVASLALPGSIPPKKAADQ